MRRTKRSLLAIVALVAAALAVVACARLSPTSPVAEAAVYGFATDSLVQGLVSQIEETPSHPVTTLRDLSERQYGDRFSRALVVINVEADIPLLPNSVERRTAPPYNHYHNQNKYYSEYLSLLTAVSRGGELSAVVVGADWYGDGFWEGLLRGDDLAAGVQVYVPSGIYDVTDQSVMDELTELLLTE